MNREILFRGKAIDNGEWVYGYLTKHYYKGEFEFCIQYFDSDMDDKKRHSVIVDQNTISQFTGLFDKNGVKIFEGDIIKDCRFCDDDAHDCSLGYVLYGERNCSCCHGVYGFSVEGNTDIRDTDEKEVIGNVHDNPTLLKAEV